MASLIITATTSGTVPNSILLDKVQNQLVAEVPIEETYTVKKPASESGAEIFKKIVEISTRNGLHADTVLRIASCESNLRQYDKNGQALRGKRNQDDVGIFQINEKYHLAQSLKLGLDINQVDDNIEYAVWLMKKEGNRHWNWSKPCWGSDRILEN